MPTASGFSLGDGLPSLPDLADLKAAPNHAMLAGEEASVSDIEETRSDSVLNIAELEKQAIKAALEKTAGNRTKAAELLGISIRTLRNKLQEYKGSDDLVGVESSAGD